MKQHLIWLFVLKFIYQPQELISQRTCGTMDLLEKQIQRNPDLVQNMNRIEEQTRRFLEESNRSVDGVITIPIVVHVVWNINAENVPDQAIYNQIQVLNEDFRRLNSNADNTWSQADDIEVEFCLATVDPDGNPTTGITRTQTTKASFSTNDNVKFTSSGGKDAWPADSYLNMWVCDIKLLFFDVLGYAQFPGGDPATDGVVIDYKAFGIGGSEVAPSDLGRTATHEIGHYLNLRHIWGDGGCNVDDFVEDTPQSNASNYGCATSHVSCNTVDMVQNYMDYSNDACMNLFTTGQKNRMRALFEPGGFRESLLVSEACGPPVASECDPADFVNAPSGLSESFTSSQLILNWDAYPNSTRCTIQGNRASAPNNGSLNVGNFNGSVSPTQRALPLNQLVAGEEYRWRVRCSCQENGIVNSPYTEFRTFIAPGNIINDGDSFLDQDKNLEQSLTTRVFPNPAEDILNISIEGLSDRTVTIDIIDITGKTVLSESYFIANEKAHRMDIKNLEQGIYLIRTSYGPNQSLLRWVKQ